jgi:hypothetical protein
MVSSVGRPHVQARERQWREQQLQRLKRATHSHHNHTRGYGIFGGRGTAAAVSAVRMSPSGTGTHAASHRRRRRGSADSGARVWASSQYTMPNFYKKIFSPRITKNDFQVEYVQRI